MYEKSFRRFCDPNIFLKFLEIALRNGFFVTVMNIFSIFSWKGRCVAINLVIKSKSTPISASHLSSQYSPEIVKTLEVLAALGPTWQFFNFAVFSSPPPLSIVSPSFTSGVTANHRRVRDYMYIEKEPTIEKISNNLSLDCRILSQIFETNQSWSRIFLPVYLKIFGRW